jgi:Mrp family chromosome partitioning ATPase
MNPTDTTTTASVDAPGTLSALQNAWSQFQAPQALPQPLSAPSEPKSEPFSPPLRESFLSLRDVPQIPFDDARAAFPMLASGYPAEWKEQVRQLRNRLGAAQSELQFHDESLQVVAFTNMDGSQDRFGTATNLALAMASIQDTRVLVIDANLAAPTLHSALRVAPGPGLAKATHASRESLPSCFRRVTGSQVYFLTAGETNSSNIDPLDFRGFHNLLRSLRNQFDWIFIDAPGFDTPADAMAVTMAADGVIMIIKSEHDSFREVARALGHVQGRRMLGAIMF